MRNVTITVRQVCEVWDWQIDWTGNRDTKQRSSGTTASLEDSLKRVTGELTTLQRPEVTRV